MIRRVCAIWVPEELRHLIATHVKRRGSGPWGFLVDLEREEAQAHHYLGFPLIDVGFSEQEGEEKMD